MVRKVRRRDGGIHSRVHHLPGDRFHDGVLRRHGVPRPRQDAEEMRHHPRKGRGQDHQRSQDHSRRDRERQVRPELRIGGHTHQHRVQAHGHSRSRGRETAHRKEQERSGRDGFQTLHEGSRLGCDSGDRQAHRRVREDRAGPRIHHPSRFHAHAARAARDARATLSGTCVQARP